MVLWLMLVSLCHGRGTHAGEKNIPSPPGQSVEGSERKDLVLCPLYRHTPAGQPTSSHWPSRLQVPHTSQQLLGLGIKLLPWGSGGKHKIHTKWATFISDDDISMFAMQLRGRVSGGGLGSYLERTEENSDPRRTINQRKALKSVV